MQLCSLCFCVCFCVCARVRVYECQSFHFSCRFETTTEGNAKPPCRQLYCGGPFFFSPQLAPHAQTHTLTNTHTRTLQSAPHPCHSFIARMQCFTYTHVSSLIMIKWSKYALLYVFMLKINVAKTCSHSSVLTSSQCLKAPMFPFDIFPSRLV